MNEETKNDNGIVLVKLYSGDMLLGKKSSASNAMPMMQFTTTLLDPRIVMIAPTMTGSVRVALMSVSEPFKVPRLKEKIEIQNSQILFELSEDEIDNELLNGYKSEISGIEIASSQASINALNDAITKAAAGKFSHK